MFFDVDADYFWTYCHENLNTSMTSALIKSTAAAISSILVVYFLVYATRWRSQYIGLHGSLPHLPFNKAFGNIPAFAALATQYPSNCHAQQIFTLLHRKYDLGALYFLDSWPVVGYRQMSISDPGLANQVQALSLRKHPMLKKVIQHICGPTSILYAEGAEWKRLRTLFNPGFAASHLMTLVPDIVDDAMIFRKRLETASTSGGLIQLEKLTSELAVDIIGHVMLDHNFDAQTTHNKFVKAFDRQVAWSPSGSLVSFFKDWNPLMPLVHWWNGRVMDGYIESIVECRINQAHQADRSKSVFDLAFEKDQTEKKRGENRTRDEVGFKRLAVDQMKTFIFAGRDTTSTTISYIFYILSLHPEALQNVRQEHDAVFGTDPTAAAQLLKNDPFLLNTLPYTTAVIKETLRLFPPASSVQTGNPHASLTLNNTTYPTASHMVWINTHTIHHLPSLFPEPDSFIPDRFLPPMSSTIPKDAWRPFEKGPRSCIGRDLSIAEMKIVMILTLREFAFENAYEEWDQKLGRKSAGEMFGYRAYQVMEATAKPADGMPMRVQKRLVENIGAAGDDH